MVTTFATSHAHLSTYINDSDLACANQEVPCGPALPLVFPDLPKACADFAHECLRLLEGSEVAALFEFVEIDQFGVSLLRPSTRGA